MCEPGARMSGILHVLHCELAENGATWSSAVVVVPIESLAPTPITNGSYAGSAIPVAPAPLWKPVLPLAATTTIPCFHACSAAYASGSTDAGCVEFVPYERLRTRMFKPGSCACWTTQ